MKRKNRKHCFLFVENNQLNPFFDTVFLPLGILIFATVSDRIKTKMQIGKMKKTGLQQTKDFSGFYIHSFMLELGLSNSALLVYAIIYSFSTRASGLCFTSNKIVADTLAVSERTVERALNSLFEKGLIKKARIGDYYGYTVTAEAAKKDKEAELTEKAEEPKAPLVTVVKDESTVAMRENTFEKSEITNTKDVSFTTIKKEFLAKKRDTYQISQEKEDLPKHLFISYGRKGYIRMTPEQYADLASLVEPEMLSFYFGRLEEICQKCYDEMTRVPKSHYKLLRKWIDEDTALKKKR